MGDTSKNVLENHNTYVGFAWRGQGHSVSLELSNEMTIYSAVVTIGDRQQLVCADSKGVPYTLTYEFSFHHDAQRNAEGQNELRRKFRVSVERTRRCGLAVRLVYPFRWHS